MNEIVQGSVLGLQDSIESEGKARKLSDFLKEEEEEESKDMDEIIERRSRISSRTRGKWRNLKVRLGFKGGIGCCGGGGAWGFSNAASDMTVRVPEEEDGEEEDLQIVSVGQIPITENSAEEDDDDAAVNRVNSPNVGHIPVVSIDSRMNLATALAAERHIRAAHELERDGPTDMIMASSTPLIRVSLMRLLEEGDGLDVKERSERKRREEEDGGGNDWMCCVCMERRKGAAFIPCGHTFCRCCSRDLWLNRGSCPICNHSIVEILDIF